jgi:hypothetical protein
MVLTPILTTNPNRLTETNDPPIGTNAKNIKISKEERKKKKEKNQFQQV